VPRSSNDSSRNLPRQDDPADKCQRRPIHEVVLGRPQEERRTRTHSSKPPKMPTCSPRNFAHTATTRTSFTIGTRASSRSAPSRKHRSNCPMPGRRDPRSAENCPNIRRRLRHTGRSAQQHRQRLAHAALVEERAHEVNAKLTNNQQAQIVPNLNRSTSKSSTPRQKCESRANHPLDIHPQGSTCQAKRIKRIRRLSQDYGLRKSDCGLGYWFRQ